MKSIQDGTAVFFKNTLSLWPLRSMVCTVKLLNSRYRGSRDKRCLPPTIDGPGLARLCSTQASTFPVTLMILQYLLLYSKWLPQHCIG